MPSRAVAAAQDEFEDYGCTGELIDIYSPTMDVLLASAWPNIVDSEGLVLAVKFRVNYFMHAAKYELEQVCEVAGVEFDFVIDPGYVRGSGKNEEPAPRAVLLAAYEGVTYVIYDDTFAASELEFEGIEDFESDLEAVVTEAEDNLLTKIFDMEEESEEDGEEETTGPEASASTG